VALRPQLSPGVPFSRRDRHSMQRTANYQEPSSEPSNQASRGETFSLSVDVLRWSAAGPQASKDIAFRRV